MTSKHENEVRQQVREIRISRLVGRGFSREQAEESHAQSERMLAEMHESTIRELVENKGYTRVTAEEFISGFMPTQWQDILNRYLVLRLKHSKRFTKIEAELTEDTILETMVDLRFPARDVAVAWAATSAWRTEDSGKRALRRWGKKAAEIENKLAEREARLKYQTAPEV